MENVKQVPYVLPHYNTPHYNAPVIMPDTVTNLIIIQALNTCIHKQVAMAIPGICNHGRCETGTVIKVT